ncbi:hypothetical protein DPMN_151914 [Dreissena polymorpha]|uniref:Uncharacterized protein n=1 Tax=Dreissena polymorpha TaxID=45954 RepID=A0A9D4FI12_DREPO|nr:hypothetical protein DPMN_151914 [Dreissena polymorpha]
MEIVPAYKDSIFLTIDDAFKAASEQVEDNHNVIKQGELKTISDRVSSLSLLVLACI